MEGGGDGCVIVEGGGEGEVKKKINSKLLKMSLTRRG